MNSIIKNEINHRKKENFQQMFFVFYNSFNNWFLSTVRYGMHHDITKKNWNVFYDYYQILREENSYLYHLNRSRCFANVDGILDLLEVLENKNQETFDYFYQILEEFNDSISIGGEVYRYVYPHRNFKFITESDFFRNEVTSLVLNEKKLKNYFSFEPDFWKYIKNRENFYEGFDFDDEMASYGVIPFYDSSQILRDISMHLPTIVGYDTLLENVKDYSLAYWYYQRLEQSFQDDSDLFIQAEIQRFQERIFVPKRKKIFHE